MLRRIFPTISPPTALGAATGTWVKGEGNEAPRYWVSAGVVHVVGAVFAGGAESAIIFAAGRVPVEVRPLEARVGIGQFFDDSLAATTAAVVTVQADGSVVLVSDATIAADDQLYFTVSYPLGY